MDHGADKPTKFSGTRGGLWQNAEHKVLVESAASHTSSQVTAQICLEAKQLLFGTRCTSGTKNQLTCARPVAALGLFAHREVSSGVAPGSSLLHWIADQGSATDPALLMINACSIVWSGGVWCNWSGPNDSPDTAGGDSARGMISSPYFSVTQRVGTPAFASIRE
ncbi:hypothetical protein CC78DRAFT_575965 [Lojkania enalia]|uniref:Uncharacterized protein n=1 Tax=Lojkania enalia TaxID=147567 RepID=A0A9P4KIF0_9PLEO|nr:hypothetical protein CC78DRAFT_575965 [Didymosphaeria enalia]